MRRDEGPTLTRRLPPPGIYTPFDDTSDEETSFQLDRMFRIAAQGQTRKVRCDRKYETKAIRQKAYRARQKARQQPLTHGQWTMLADAIVEALARIMRHVPETAPAWCPEHHETMQDVSLSWRTV